MKIYSNTTYKIYRAMNLSMFLHLSCYQWGLTFSSQKIDSSPLLPNWDKDKSPLGGQRQKS